MLVTNQMGQFNVVSLSRGDPFRLFPVHLFPAVHSVRQPAR